MISVCFIVNDVVVHESILKLLYDVYDKFACNYSCCAQGISMTSNVNKMVKAGFEVKLLMADWFARMNPQITRKVGSDLSNIQTIGRYNIEVWKAIGMNLGGVEVVQLSDKISCKTDEYWSLAMDIARKSDLSRIKSWLRVYASKDPRYLHVQIIELFKFMFSLENL